MLDDATTARLNRRFDLVLLIVHAFQAFLTPDNQAAALSQPSRPPRTGGNLEMTVVPTREREFESLSSDRSAAGEKPGLSRIRRVVIQQP
jgi:hypothetical protein